VLAERRTTIDESMRIAVISDTHEKLPPQVCTSIAGADEIWHLGDVTSVGTLETVQRLGPPVRVVRGNCDFCFQWPETLDFELEGFRVHLVHIPPRQITGSPDLLLHGHTHVPRDQIVGATRCLNPGCVSKANKGAPPSFAWLELKQGEPLRWKVQRI
jgi:putative phosphoesterase